MAGHVRRIEPLEREHARARARAPSDTVPHPRDALLHLGNQRFRALARAGCTTDVADALEDRSEIVGIQSQDLSFHSEDNLTLWHRTHITDPLGEHEIRLE